ncbi:DNA-binding protein [Brachybacterium endophyticum]|uniref:DNA-binding protein n=2 Tax=Brachybacterium endophyticum TaxID=2182385 RepID=A0A2U2RGP2_9MICO|nr:DNA-binding protein [Brachybacterium endophyticum]
MFVSLDGFAAGTYVTLEEPFGEAMALTRGHDGRAIHGIGNIEDITFDGAMASMFDQGIGVEIMGRRKFGPQSGPWTEDGWRGWWGEEPPFRTPVIVLTHHEREPIAFDNGTVFHFLDASPQEALRRARELAPGADVRIGGGPTTVREFLAADLVDTMHLVIVPVTIGVGTRLLEDGIPSAEDFDIRSVTLPSGRTHQLWNRRRGD